MVTSTQMPQFLIDIIDAQLSLYNKQRKVTLKDEIPETDQIPINDPLSWVRIPDVVCVFVDMKGSTQLSATMHDNGTAGAYQLFTGTAVRFFAAMETPYIDVRGDGVFGLFNSNQVYRAIATAISFRTFAETECAPAIKNKTTLEIGAHIGIDQRTVLVRKVGLRRHNGRTDRQNEVWAGKPVNMASKLASIGDAGEILVSDRYYQQITDDLVRKSCGCPKGMKVDLWEERDVTEDPKFDFDKAYVLKSRWCQKHGREYYEAILGLDKG